MPSLHIEHLENFITEVVADFNGDFACRGSRERLAGGAGKVIKGKWNENNFMLRHGMVSRLSSCICPLQCLSESRRQD